MEKEVGQIKFTETDDGFRIDIKGKSLREALSCCCVPIVGGGREMKVTCCPPGEEKK